MEKNGSEKQLIFEEWEHSKTDQKWPQCKGYSPCKLLSLDKNKIATRCQNVSTNALKLFCGKNGSLKHLIFEKWEHFQNDRKWPQCKGYGPCKLLSLDQKIKLLKHAKNVSTNALNLFYAKNGSEKQLIFEKWEHSKNDQKWPQWKGYSPCKILSLDQKIKLLKHAKNVSRNALELFYGKNGS